MTKMHTYTPTEKVKILDKIILELEENLELKESDSYFVCRIYDEKFININKEINLSMFEKHFPEFELIVANDSGAWLTDSNYDFNDSNYYRTNRISKIFALEILKQIILNP